MPIKTTTKCLIFLLTSAVLAIAITAAWFYFLGNRNTKIRVGILHSQTGTMAMSELPVIDATLLAIEEINRQGGLLGKIIEPILADGASDPSTFAAQAEKLITQDKVSVIFGCWTSACRKAVKEVVEKYDHLLFYPVQYEGLEDSRNIIYTGAAPNQQILPAVTWCFYNLGKTFFLIGSDYVFPRMANELIKDQAKLLGAKVIGEAYQPLGSLRFKSIVEDIVRLKPQVIINTINGSSNIAFFKELRNVGITPDKIPTMSLSIAEEELKIIGQHALTGDYATWSYFQSIQRPENIIFVKAFKKRYGQNRVVSDPLETAYFGVYLWSQAVKNASAVQPSIIKEAVKKEGRDAPEGIVYIDPDNNHTWKSVRIGKVTQGEQFSQVWSSEAIHPMPFPILSENRNWEGFLERLYEGWNKKWSAE